MLTILQKDISMFLNLWKAITSFFGFGIHFAKFVCLKAGRKRPIFLKEIDPQEIEWINDVLSTLNFLVGPELERELYFRTNKLKVVKTYRAMRLRQGLPSRGQRTHTNAKTTKRLKGMWEKSSFAKRMEKRKKKKNYEKFFSGIGF